MHIEEIVLEGFKSYATRTVITGWDKDFNAITGLNGSGKSNILDAICFVLGIDNLRQIRATSLQDLVYKRGQAGITKATVTVVFNNEDPKGSPVGFQDAKQIMVSRQIVLGGKNTFKINGISVPQNRLEMLFQSVQLNVNNPHFLIMQGRITKVLNMKPPEIVAMIEETAGTRMYEERKEKAEGTMEKKERKVEEITNLIRDTIAPKMEKLKEERKAYLAYQVVAKDIAKMEKLSTAMAFHAVNSKAQQCKRTIDECNLRTEQRKKSIREKEAELAEIAKQLDLLQSVKRKSGKSKALMEAEEHVRLFSNQAESIQARLDIQQDQLRQNEAHFATLSSQIAKMTSGSHGHTDTALDKYDKAKKICDDKKKELSQLEELYNGLTTGISKKGEQIGYAKLVQEEMATTGQLTAEYQKLLLSKSQMEEEASSLSVGKKSIESAVVKAEQDIAVEEGRLGALRDSLARITFDEKLEKTLRDQKKTLEKELQSLGHELEQKSNGLSLAHFDYTDPGNGFNHAAVKGFVAQLITIPKENCDWTNALEICAGGRLYNVVVETEKEASALLERGNLKKRVTIIPLSKIQSYPLPQDKLSKIDQSARGKAQVAMSLIAFEKDLAPAMQYIFGASILCEDKDTASKIAYEKSLAVKCITKEGDVYDPAGTMTGGSSSPKGNILSTLSEINRLKDTETVLSKDLNHVINQLEEISRRRSMASEKENECERLAHDIQVKKQKLLADPSYKTYKRLLMLQDCIAKANDDASSLRIKLDESNSKLIKYQASSHGATDPARLEEMQRAIVLLKGEMPRLLKALAELSDAKSQHEASKAAEHDDLNRKQQELAMLTSSITEARSEIKSLNIESSTVQAALESHKKQAEVERAKAIEADADLGRLEAAFKACQDESSQLLLQEKRMEHDRAAAKEELQICDKRISEMISKNLWIEHEKHNFNVAGGEYDFTHRSIEDVQRQIADLRQVLKRTSGSLNTQVIEMMDSLEKKENELKAHLRTVKEDKEKIERTIMKLNEYKRESLDKTWKKINQDFGEIFSVLLPGGFAQLSPMEGMPLASGVEIQVRLGNVWKKNLTELSGGQRSLVALSLILSLLQFKPAPMYILDEIDAALDLSHTQNIGKLLKYKFKSSQFIVVSLKDGLFTNANVLFRTKFVDGVSTVERTAHKEDESHPQSTKKTVASLKNRLAAEIVA